MRLYLSKPKSKFILKTIYIVQEKLEWSKVEDSLLKQEFKLLSNEREFVSIKTKESTFRTHKVVM